LKLHVVDSAQGKYPRWRVVTIGFGEAQQIAYETLILFRLRGN
jgi:hypothetical protein